MVDESVLREYVRESNLIEGIIDRPGRPLFDKHLEVVKRIAAGEYMHPNEIHALLFQNVPGIYHSYGKYRTFDVWVGYRKMPRWEVLPKLMRDWFVLQDKYLKDDLSPEECARSARFLGAWFACIHPYEDGNGRMERIYCNMLRVQKGLSWRTVKDSKKEDYYAYICFVEEEMFKKHYTSEIY